MRSSDPPSPPQKHTLEQHLGRCYGAPNGYAPPDSVDQFTQALQGDSDMMAAAKARLAQLEALEAACNGDVGKRCTLSKAALETLRSVLK